MSDLKQWIVLVVFIANYLGAGGLGAIATTPEIDSWYKTIAKPSWNPPGYVFGPVWTTLFVMMGIAKIIGLWLAIAATILVFFKNSKIAGWLMVPYLAWVSFASVLNFAIWKLN